MSESLIHKTSILNKRELELYQDYLEVHGEIIAPNTSLIYYQQFLAGFSCEEIAIKNPGVDVGSIIDARLRYKWDERKEEYISNLYKTMQERYVQVQMEAVHYVSDMLSAAHKLNGDKYRRFLISGNPNDLEGLEISSLKQYKEVVDLLLKLTGQDKKQQIVQEVKHVVESRNGQEYKDFKQIKETKREDINVKALLKELDNK